MITMHETYLEAADRLTLDPTLPVYCYFPVTPEGEQAWDKFLDISETDFWAVWSTADTEMIVLYLCFLAAAIETGDI